jgi:hypothetical protein
MTTPTGTVRASSGTVGGVSAGTPFATSSGGSSDYATLMNEIKLTIDKNDNLFKQIQQSNYPNAGSYTSDLLNYKIDTQVTDLTKARQDIWDFLNKKYAENTKLRTYYFDEIRKSIEHIDDLNYQQKDLIDSIEEKEVKHNTANESIKNEKYAFNKMEYYLFLYKTLITVLINILIIIALCIFGIIPRSTCLIIIIIILIATASFVGYYVFFVNIGRSMFSWSKFEHDNNIPVITSCSSGAYVSDADKKKAEVNNAVIDLIKQNQNAQSNCAAPSE